MLDINHWHGAAGFRRTLVTHEQKAWSPGLPHIGYHWVIYTNGGLATGRHESEVGAHARGLNANSLGLCLIGTDKFTLLQWSQLQQQVEHLCKRHRIPTDLATAETYWRGICGHRDTGAKKLCPGFSVSDWLAGGMQPLAGHILEQSK